MKNAVAEVRVWMQAAHPKRISTEGTNIPGGSCAPSALYRRFSTLEGFATEPRYTRAGELCEPTKTRGNSTDTYRVHGSVRSLF